MSIAQTKTCPTCSGSGRVSDPFGMGPMHIIGISTGNYGLGILDKKTCGTCGGSGKVPDTTRRA